MTSLNEFYGFQQAPFTKSVAAKDLYPSRGHREAQGRLAFALQDRTAALLTGDVGTGKSTTARAFAQALDHVRAAGLVKVLGSQHAIQASMEDSPGWLEMTKVL